MTTRVIPRSASLTCAAYGRTYTGGQGAQDVPDGDAMILTANGWISFGAGNTGLSCATSARPVPGAGSVYDETLGEVITWLPDYPSLGVNGHWVNWAGSQV